MIRVMHEHQSGTIGSILQTEGFIIIHGLFNKQALSSLINDLEQISAFDYQAGSTTNLAGLLGTSICGERLFSYISDELSSKPAAINAFILDKLPQSNWELPWHQDTFTYSGLNMQEEPKVRQFQQDKTPIFDTDFKNKPVSAPIHEKILIARVHLDDCHARNGAISVIPRSHRLGILSAGQINELVKTQAHQLCTAPAGSVMLMKPLLIHNSPRTECDEPRRILHIEYTGIN